MVFPLNCKEIQPVHPKGDQSWVFIGRTDVQAQTSILWPPDVKSWFIGKDPDAGKDWGQEGKGTTEDEMVGWHHWIDGHGFGWIPGVGDGQGGLTFMGSQRVRRDWATELNGWFMLRFDREQQNSVKQLPFNLKKENQMWSKKFEERVWTRVSAGTAAEPSIALQADLWSLNEKVAWSQASASS